MSNKHLRKLKVTTLEEKKKKPNWFSWFLRQFFSEERNVFFIFFVNLVVTFGIGGFLTAKVMSYVYTGEWVSFVEALLAIFVIWFLFSDLLLSLISSLGVPDFALLPILIPVYMAVFYFVAWVIVCLIKSKILLHVDSKMTWCLLFSQWLALLLITSTAIYKFFMLEGTFNIEGVWEGNDFIVIFLMSMLFTSITFWITIEYFRKRKIKKDKING